MQTVHRFITVFGAMFLALLLAASAAFAHQCYNASRSDTGNAHAANGQALFTYEELLGILCPAGADIVEDWVGDNDEFDTDGIVIQSRALMGGGRHETDGHAIDYLPEGLTAAIGQAFGACGGPPAA